MARFAAAGHRVFYVEQAVEGEPGVRVEEQGRNIWTLTPVLPPGRSSREDELVVLGTLRELGLGDHVTWVYDPMHPLATRDAASGRTLAVVYDCMDELSAFDGAPAGLAEAEREVMRRAGVVFTGGRSLFEAKRGRHANIHPMPSSVDVQHFSVARRPLPDPPDQAGIPHPRAGYYGAVDERLDLALLAELAERIPELQLVMVGGVVKISPSELPRRPNIHYLGLKSYDRLPAYLAGWEVALLPFRLCAATEFISPTKVPEYLAGGKPVVSTPIRDVVRPYGEEELVWIASDVDEFVEAVRRSLGGIEAERLRRADARLATMSWDSTWREMRAHLEALLPQGSPSRASEDLAAVVA
jgi:UDP-galactopyranose mutase